jgi:hypothetical integral membrane protein (TIGR02206 family)
MSLRTFFGHDIDFDQAATMWSIHHLLYVASAALTIVLVLRYAVAIRASRHEAAIKRAVFVTLVVLEIFYHIHNWTYPRLSVPLHICSFAVFMSLVILRTDSKRVFDYLFFFGTLGGIMALAFPNTFGYTYLNVRYYHFLILHNLLIAISLYYYKAYGYRVTYATLWRVYKTVLVAAIFVHLINLTFLHFGIDSNYWFITYIPYVVEDTFTSYPLYLLTFLSSVFVTMNLLFFISHPDARARLRTRPLD